MMNSDSLVASLLRSFTNICQLICAFVSCVCNVCELALKMGVMCFCISVSILIKFPRAIQLSIILL